MKSEDLSKIEAGEHSSCRDSSCIGVAVCWLSSGVCASKGEKP